MNGVDGGERDGDGSDVERSLGRERRFLGFSESNRSFGMDDGFFKFDRLRRGVRPVEEEAAGSGPGSENRTRFLDFVGVFASSEATLSGLARCSAWFVASARLATAELPRLLRRVAMGRSSGTSPCVSGPAFPAIFFMAVLLCEQNCQIQC